MSADPPTAAAPGFTLLSDLPRGHEVRVRPLREMQAQCRNKLSKEWRSMATWFIGQCGYDELGENWAANYEFRVPGETGTAGAAGACPAIAAGIAVGQACPEVT